MQHDDDSNDGDAILEEFLSEEEDRKGWLRMLEQYRADRAAGLFDHVDPKVLDQTEHFMQTGETVDPKTGQKIKVVEVPCKLQVLTGPDHHMSSQHPSDGTDDATNRRSDTGARSRTCACACRASDRRPIRRRGVCHGSRPFR